VFVAGVDGCRCGWIAFMVELRSLKTSIEIVDLALLLRDRPRDLVCLAIDIPIGLSSVSRKCDVHARHLLGQPRCSSVFAPPCREALQARDYEQGCHINEKLTGNRLSQQAWGIARKIRQVDEAITPECQQWAFEVHPEVCFWALAGKMPMSYRKKTKDGREERLNLLRAEFPTIEEHLTNCPKDVGKDDVLDAAVAAWSALRLYSRKAVSICEPECDSRGLSVAIWY
jgi:predicted RNase H-like nuclease